MTTRRGPAEGAVTSNCQDAGKLPALPAKQHCSKSGLLSLKAHILILGIRSENAKLEKKMIKLPWDEKKV